MDVWEMFGWVVAAVLVAVGIYFRVMGKGTEAAYFEKLSSMQTTARDVVAAAEQLWKTGN
jgi:hypothetical protein